MADWPLMVSVHTGAALVALIVGTVQFLRKKGGGYHRTLGWIWVTAMAIVAASSFGINGFEVIFGLGPIHLISIYVLISLPLAVLAAQRKNIKAHASAMKGMYVGGLVVAGLLALFLPGRTLYNALIMPLWSGI